MNLAGRPSAPFHEMYTPEPNSGCWLWLGSTNPKGYGQKRVNKKLVSAHRLSWELYVGALPGDAEVCHRCDNPPCVNPRHLFLGTHAENMRDMAAKGRTGITTTPRNVGSANGMSRLTEQAVREIRALRDGGTPNHEVARRFGVSPASVTAIACRQRWRHVA